MPEDLGNIMPTCRVKTIDDSGDRLKYIVWGVVLYTPKHINDVLVANDLQGAFVTIFGCNEYWTRGKHFASQIKKDS